jgi:hypothetical protein
MIDAKAKSALFGELSRSLARASGTVDPDGDPDGYLVGKNEAARALEGLTKKASELGVDKAGVLAVVHEFYQRNEDAYEPVMFSREGLDIIEAFLAEDRPQVGSPSQLLNAILSARMPEGIKETPAVEAPPARTPAELGNRFRLNSALLDALLEHAGVMVPFSYGKVGTQDIVARPDGDFDVKVKLLSRDDGALISEHALVVGPDARPPLPPAKTVAALMELWKAAPQRRFDLIQAVFPRRSRSSVAGIDEKSIRSRDDGRFDVKLHIGTHAEPRAREVEVVVDGAGRLVPDMAPTSSVSPASGLAKTPQELLALFTHDEDKWAAAVSMMPKRGPRIFTRDIDPASVTLRPDGDFDLRITVGRRDSKEEIHSAWFVVGSDGTPRPDKRAMIDTPPTAGKATSAVELVAMFRADPRRALEALSPVFGRTLRMQLPKLDEGSVKQRPDGDFDAKAQLTERGGAVLREREVVLSADGALVADKKPMSETPPADGIARTADELLALMRNDWKRLGAIVDQLFVIGLRRNQVPSIGEAAPRDDGNFDAKLFVTTRGQTEPSSAQAIVLRPDGTLVKDG